MFCSFNALLIRTTIFCSDKIHLLFGGVYSVGGYAGTKFVSISWNGTFLVDKITPNQPDNENTF